MTARLVAARALTGDAGPSWVTLLQSCGAYQAFLRSARGAVDDRRAVEFLLLDPLFPRSLMSALVAAERCLDELGALHGASERGRGSEAHRVLGMIRSELEFAPTAELFEDVYEVMERVQSACSVASDAIARRYFPRGVVTAGRRRELAMTARYRIHHTSPLRLRPAGHARRSTRCARRRCRRRGRSRLESVAARRASRPGTTATSTTGAPRCGCSRRTLQHRELVVRRHQPRRGRRARRPRRPRRAGTRLHDGMVARPFDEYLATPTPQPAAGELADLAESSPPTTIRPRRAALIAATRCTTR